MRLAWAIWGFLLVAAAPQDIPDRQKQDYEKLVRDSDLDKHPERHATVAAWCRSRRWTERADFHDLAYRRSQFEKEKVKLKDPAPAADLKRLLDTAARLKLDDEVGQVRPLWLSAELKERRTAVKEGDTAALKTLLTWAVKENAGAAARPLAEEILKLDLQDEAANTLLGRVRDGGGWIDPWDLLARENGLKDIKARYKVHKQLETLRKEPPKAYPKDPYASYEKVEKEGWPPVWRGSIRGLGDGKGIHYVWAPATYVPTKSYPLIVQLHGGGAGGLAFADQTAHNMTGGFSVYWKEFDCVVATPRVRNHVANSWNIKENMLDVIDGILDVCERFNIDRKRIYLTGSSMGGQGTSRFAWVVPEAFAAFSPMAGAYWNDHPVPDLSGKAFLVLHGAKDEKFRNDTLTVFLDKIKKANAEVEYVNFENEGHNLSDQKTFPLLGPFLKKHVNEFAPDLRLVRRVIEETVTEKPYKID